MRSALQQRGFRTFGLIWIGQLISLTGTSMTGFALGVWVYQRTGSVTQFALIALFVTTPTILISPIAGALVDRWDRRWAMILSDVGAGIGTLIMALLLFADGLEVWHIYLAVGISSVFSAFQWPAYTAATTLLVPKEHYGRASGMVQLSEAAAQIVSPVIAGILVVSVGVKGVILLDVVSFTFAVGTLLLVRIPRPPVSTEGEEGKGSLLKEAAYGWNYIRARSGLFGLLIFFAVTNFSASIAMVLFQPMILELATPAVLGTIMSVSGIGMLIGGVTMSAWGGPKRKIYGVLLFELLIAFCLILAGLKPSLIMIGAAAFIAFFGIPLINGSSQAIWQRKVAPDVQGRVFSIRRMIAMSAQPISFLIAGPLADRVFEPLLAVDGWLAASVGQVIGVGPGRGMAFMFILMGVFGIFTVGAGYLYPRLRLVELELPDAITEEQRQAVFDE
jgi:MFS family permease